MDRDRHTDPVYLGWAGLGRDRVAWRMSSPRLTKQQGGDGDGDGDGEWGDCNCHYHRGSRSHSPTEYTIIDNT